MTYQYKAITSIPGLGEELDEYGTDYDLKSVGTSYAVVPYVFRAVRLRCNSLSSVPVRLETAGGDNADWPFSISPTRLLWLIEASLLFHGAAYFVKHTNGGRNVVRLQYLNPSTVQVKGDVPGALTFIQEINGRQYGPWTEDQMIYIREYDPDQDIQPGVPAVYVALKDAGLLHYMTNLASNFFQNGGMPVTLVGLDRPVPEGERDKAERKLSRMVSGIRNAFRVRFVPSPMTPVQLTPPIKDLAMAELDLKARRAIATALEIPPTMLEDAANYATAQEHRLSFWQDTVRPRGQMVEEDLTSQLFGPMGLKMVMDFESLDIFQVDENERAESLDKLVTAGVPLDVALEVLGYDLTEDQKARIKKSLADKEAMAQRLTATLNTGNQDQDKDQDTDQKTGPGKDQKDQPKSRGVDQWPMEVKATPDEVRRELANWQRKSIGYLREGRSPTAPWRSQFIPGTVEANVHLGLAGALTEADVKAVFDAAFSWVKYYLG